MYDIFLYLGMAVAIIYGVYQVAEYIRKKKRRKSAAQKMAISGKAAMLSQYSDQRFRINMMALEAEREMFAAAARNSASNK